MIIVLRVEFSSFYFQEYDKICKDLKILSIKNFQLLYMAVSGCKVCVINVLYRKLWHSTMTQALLQKKVWSGDYINKPVTMTLMHWHLSLWTFLVSVRL